MHLSVCEVSHEYLVGEKIFSNQQPGMRVYLKLVIIFVKEYNVPTSQMHIHTDFILIDKR
jgi:hypothetical protein